MLLSELSDWNLMWNEMEALVVLISRHQTRKKRSKQGIDFDISICKWPDANPNIFSVSFFFALRFSCVSRRADTLFLSSKINTISVVSQGSVLVRFALTEMSVSNRSGQPILIFFGSPSFPSEIPRLRGSPILFFGALSTQTSSGPTLPSELEGGVITPPNKGSP